MNWLEPTCCPICKISLEKIQFTRHDEFICSQGHYYYLDLFELDEKSIVLNLKNYSLIFRMGARFESVSIYNMVGHKFIMDIPIIQFDWNDLDILNERIKKLVMFS